MLQKAFEVTYDGEVMTPSPSVKLKWLARQKFPQFQLVLDSIIARYGVPKGLPKVDGLNDWLKLAREAGGPWRPLHPTDKIGAESDEDEDNNHNDGLNNHGGHDNAADAVEDGLDRRDRRRLSDDKEIARTDDKPFAQKIPHLQTPSHPTLENWRKATRSWCTFE